jgi:hypothetical protein
LAIRVGVGIRKFTRRLGEMGRETGQDFGSKIASKLASWVQRGHDIVREKIGKQRTSTVARGIILRIEDDLGPKGNGPQIGAVGMVDAELC